VPATFRQAINMVRGGMHQAFGTEIPDGKVMLVALYEQPVEWGPIAVINNSVRMIGCFAGPFAPSIELLKKKRINTRSLVTHHFSLSETKLAFDTQLKTRESIKVLVKP
jgi:threonine dehydrogenase-like Zn-dependent dehydrogenase